MDPRRLGRNSDASISKALASAMRQYSVAMGYAWMAVFVLGTSAYAMGKFTHRRKPQRIEEDKDEED
eukprot:TRINITY_DN3281_c0_g1_i1.p2 TRINITY_DN3281_c0_g1~~TRINITY_DN3281_c0_g1_i1.p2  ORF type:complete len:67 (-),score=7.64 TRINITY_DN3281_c0_g1_i1:165-365(-)